MINNKKSIILISCFLSIILISSFTLLTINLLINDDFDKLDYKRPLNRGRNYEHFKLRKWLLENNDLHSIINAKFENDVYVHYIEESKLKDFFKNKFRNLFKSISKFEANADYFEVKFNYQLFNNNSGLLLDVVWNLPNSSYYYYDQIKLTLC